MVDLKSRNRGDAVGGIRIIVVVLQTCRGRTRWPGNQGQDLLSRCVKQSWVDLVSHERQPNSPAVARRDELRGGIENLSIDCYLSGNILGRTCNRFPAQGRSKVAGAIGLRRNGYSDIADGVFLAE